MNLSPNPRDIVMRTFPGIQPRDADEIIACGTLRRFAPGEIVCREGAQEDSFYLVLTGDLRVSKGIGPDEDRELTRLSSGAFFGEMAIISGAPRAATVSAINDGELLEVHNAGFQGVLQSKNAVLLAIIRAVSQRLRENDEMAIDDLRLKARELAEAYQQLAEDDYARSQFLSTVAHELRTPLTAAGGFVEVIRMGMLSGDALDSALDTVGRNLSEVVALTNDILFLQEMEMILPQFRIVDMPAVVSAAVEQLRSRAQRSGVGVRLTFAPNGALVNGHARSLQRAVAAIVDNAIKFSPAGGEVLVSLVNHDGEVRVTVEDHGVGIPPDVLPRIFQRFFHVEQMDNRLFRGIGIGLAIARQVIKYHGGKILVDSEVGRGSTFTIELNATD